VGFLAAAVVTVAIVAAVGYVPTRRLVGDSGPRAMVMGCAISLLASVVGSIPMVFGVGSELLARQRSSGALLALGSSMALRLAVVVVGALAAGLSGRWAVAPLLVWVGISYGALLVPDTLFAVRSIREETAKKE